MTPARCLLVPGPWIAARSLLLAAVLVCTRIGVAGVVAGADTAVHTGPAPVADQRLPVGEMALDLAPAGESPALAVELTHEERAFIAEHRDVVLGVDVEWRPLIFENSDGSFTGIDADTVAIINAAVGTRIRFETGKWADLVERARRREIDGLSSSAAHPERARDLLFTQPYTSVGRSILVRTGNPLGIRSIADLAGRRMGHARGNLVELKMIESIDGTVPVPAETSIAVLNDLIGGQTDAMFGGDLDVDGRAEQDVGSVEEALFLDKTTDLVFPNRQDWPLMVSAIDKALAALPLSERMVIKQRSRLPRRAPGEIGLSAQEQAWLDERGRKLSYCFDPVWSPLDHRQDGAQGGMFREYLELFAEKLDIALEPLRARDLPALERLVESRACDLVSGLARTPDWERYLSFTAPYVTLTLVLVGREDAPFVAGIESLKGVTIGVPPYSAIESMLKGRFPDQPLVGLANIDAFEQGLGSGRVYAVVATLEHAAQLVEQGLGRFRIIGKLDDPYPISVAVRTDQPLLLSIMQKAVSATTPAERDQIAQRRTKFEIAQRLDLARLWQLLGVIGLVGLFLGYRHMELTRLNRKLRAAKEAAEVARRDKGELLANMSHEIRTPLNAVLNLAALGARGGDAERLRGYLDEIQRAGQSLLAVVNEILDFSRLEGGGDSYRGEVFVFSDLVDRVVRIAAPLAEEKGLHLRVEMACALDGRWLGDAQKIERVLVNLIGNAVKFTDRGEVVLGAACAGGQDGVESVVFEVRDTGIGIDPEQFPTLFEPFKQGDMSLARRHGGSGLGLAIVKGLVDRMQGAVTAEPCPAGGSCFRVEVPLMRLPGESMRRRPEPVDEPRRPESVADLCAGRPKRVLVVEDNGVNRQIACEILGEQGLAVETAADGEGALAILDADPFGFGLVLMDVQMPGLDGYETTRRLRRDPRFAELPVVAVTAHVLAEDCQRCLDAGMNAHLAKPFSPEDLADLVRHWISLPSQVVPQGLATGVPAPLAHVGSSTSKGWLDIEAGLEITGGHADLYERLLREFVDAQGAQVQLLDPARGPVPWDAIQRLTHMLRGTAPLLGAHRLAEIAAVLDDRLRADGLAAAGDLCPLAEAMVGTLAEADAYLSRAGSTPRPAGFEQGEPTEGPIEPLPAHILIVDDDATVATVLSELLGNEHRVSIARGGSEGLALARGAQAPDLILLDVMMEGMDGYTVCRNLKLDPRTRDIPVIFVTGRGGAEDEHHGFQLGAVDYIHKPFERRVVLARVRNHLAVKRQGDVLVRLSEQDSLTGLPNRRRLDRYLDETWSRLVSDGGSLALLMMDVDHFKRFNDHYGHLAGDDCLRRVAQAIQGVCREGSGLVGRYGGEEFLWAIPEADEVRAREAAESAAAAVRALAIPHAACPRGDIVTLSVGVRVCRPDPSMRVADCLDEADRRLYKAKSAGRDRVQC